MAITQRVSDNIPEIGGGVTGVGGTVALREFVDVRNGQVTTLFGDPGTTLGRLGRPSVVYGLGSGLAALGGWWLAGRSGLSDFLFAHGVTGIPSGAGSAVWPKQPPTTAATGTRGLSRTRVPNESRSGSGSSASRSGSGGGGGQGGLSSLSGLSQM